MNVRHLVIGDPMGMLQFCILSLSTLLQDPEPAPGTAAVSSPPRIEVQNLAGWLPENAVATLLVQPLAGSSTVLETSPMVRLWNDESFAATRQLLSRGIGQIGTGLGLPTATLLELAGNGFAFGIAEGDGGDRPEVLLALVLGNAEAAVRSASARWSTGEGLHSAAGTAFSRLKDAPLLYGILRGCLVVCSNIAQIDAAEARFAAGTGADLASNPGQAPPLVRFRLALDRLQQLVERRLPPTVAPRVTAVATALGLSGSRNFELSWTVNDGALRMQANCDLPDRTGLVPALVGDSGMLLPALAQAVPLGAEAFAVGGIDLGATLAAVLDCAKAGEPEGEQAIDGFIAATEQKAKIDLHQDVIAAFSGCMVTAQWREKGETVFGIGVRLRNSMRFQSTLRNLLGMLPVQPEKVDCGVAALAFPQPPGSEARPTLAIVDDWLIVGNAPGAVAGFCRQIRSRKPNPVVADLLRNLPTGTTWVVWQSPSALRNTAFGSGDAAVPEALLEELEPAVTHVVRGEGSVQWQSDAAMAGMQAMLLARQAAQRLTGAMAGGVAKGARTPTRKPAVLPTPAPAQQGGKPVATGAKGGGSKPGGSKAAAAAPPTIEDPLATEAEIAVLAAAAKDPAKADLVALAALLGSASPAVAVRATWCLGQNKTMAAMQVLGSSALVHKEPEVRRQALAALLANPGAPSTGAAIAALGDADRGVRTLAAELVGRSHQKDSIDALLGMVRTQLETDTTEPLTDVAAAVLAVHDLADPRALVPVATAVTTDDPLAGQALAFLFQGLSPKLLKSDEAEVMVAVLDHQSPLLRRYAIQRLSELADPAAAKVLEARLAKESQELQPLVRLALDRVRGQELKLADDLATRIRTNVGALGKLAQAHLLAVGGGLVLLVMLVSWITVLRVRAARRRRGEMAAELAAPTEGFQIEETYEGDATTGVEQEELVGAGPVAR